MMLRLSGPRYGSASDSKPGQEDEYELIQHNKRNPSLSSISNACTYKTSKLPAKRLPCRSPLRRYGSMAIMGFITASVIVSLSILASYIRHYEPSTTWTDISNPMSCDLTTNNGSSVQSAFVINLRGSTKLSFAEAKLIDVVWQLMIGVGGRCLMGWVAYKSFMDGLTCLMEQLPVSYDLYASLTFSTDSLLSLWQALKAVFTLRGWKGKCFLMWFILSTAYILGFQLIVSATAGYVQPSSAGFRMLDGNFIAGDSDALKSCFNVTSGALLNMTNGTLVTGPAVKDYDVEEAKRGIFTVQVNRSFPGFVDLLSASTSWLSPPVYSDFDGNHSFSSWDYWNHTTTYTTNFTFMNHTYNFTNYRFEYGKDYTSRYCYNNHSIDSTALRNSAQCISEPYFVWGLSSLLVKVVLVLQIVWVLGTYSVWLSANLSSELCRNGRKVRGPFRATEDLSAAIREVLGEETCAYSEEQLAKHLSNQAGLRYYSEDLRDSGTSHIGLSSVRLRTTKLDRLKIYGTGTGTRIETKV